MDKRARFILKMLDQLIGTPKIPLIHKDPYTLLIAVLLSAQCTDERVNQVTPKLFAFADTPQKMAKLPLPVIEETIRTCGLYRAKAKAIHRLSEILVEKYQGQVPSSFEALEELPGVGHKTASVVMCQAFQQAAFPVDTHIWRLAKRWGLSEGKNVRQVEQDLMQIFPQKYWIALHLQMVLYGRRYCPARGHSESACPICQGLKK